MAPLSTRSCAGVSSPPDWNGSWRTSPRSAPDAHLWHQYKELSPCSYLKQEVLGSSCFLGMNWRIIIAINTAAIIPMRYSPTKNEYPTMPRTSNMMNMFRAVVRFVLQLCARQWSLYLSGRYYTYFGLLESSGLLYTSTSCNSSLGSNSAMASKHRFTCAGRSKHHYVPSLVRSFSYYFYGMFLTDDLFDHFFGNLISLVDVISNPPRSSWFFTSFSVFPCFTWYISN